MSLPTITRWFEGRIMSAYLDEDELTYHMAEARAWVADEEVKDKLTGLWDGV